MSESPGGVKDRMSQGAEHLGQEAQQKVSEAKEVGSAKLSEQLDRRTTDVGRQTKSLAEALRRTGQNMQQQGQGDGVDKVTSGIADRLERVGGYLESARGDNMLRDAERYARQHRWLVAGGAAIAGLVASRFLKASSERRYDSDAGMRRASSTWSPATTADLYAETDPALGRYGRVEPAPVGRGV